MLMVYNDLYVEILNFYRNSKKLLLNKFRYKINSLPIITETIFIS